eukprot:430978-Rhodomonas_salina.1
MTMLSERLGWITQGFVDGSRPASHGRRLFGAAEAMGGQPSLTPIATMCFPSSRSILIVGSFVGSFSDCYACVSLLLLSSSSSSSSCGSQLTTEIGQAKALDGSANPVDKSNYLPLPADAAIFTSFVEDGEGKLPTTAQPEGTAKLTRCAGRWVAFWRIHAQFPPGPSFAAWPDAITSVVRRGGSDWAVPLEEEKEEEKEEKEEESEDGDGRRVREAGERRRREGWGEVVEWYKREVESVSEELGCGQGGGRLLVYVPGVYEPDVGYQTFGTKHPIGIGNRMVQVGPNHSRWRLGFGFSLFFAGDMRMHRLPTPSDPFFDADRCACRTLTLGSGPPGCECVGVGDRYAPASPSPVA